MLDSNPINQYNIFLLTSFLRRVKATNETTTLLTCFVYNTTLRILINKLSHGHNFSLVSSAFLYKRFCTNKCACLDKHHPKFQHVPLNQVIFGYDLDYHPGQWVTRVSDADLVSEKSHP